MTEHKHPDDGGLPYHPVGSGDIRDPTGITIRAKFAETFAAAWLPLARATNPQATEENIGNAANTYGLSMADDLLRRLRGEGK